MTAAVVTTICERPCSGASFLELDKMRRTHSGDPEARVAAAIAAACSAFAITLEESER